MRKIKGARLFATGLALAAAIFSYQPMVASAWEEPTPDISTENIQVTVPTEIPCSLMPDGTVVAPTNLSIVNSGDAVVVDAIGMQTGNYIHNCPEFSMNIGDERVLVHHADNTETRPETGFTIGSGVEKPITLEVSKLDRKSHAQLIDQAANGKVNMLQILFSFNLKALQGHVDVGSTSVTVRGAVNAKYFTSGYQAFDPVDAHYQWFRDEVPIQGASGSKYQTVADDVGHGITCRVTDSKGKYAGSVVSSVVEVTPGNFVGTCTIPDMPLAGETVTATFTPKYEDYDGTPAYQWCRLNKVEDTVFRDLVAQDPYRNYKGDFSCGENATLILDSYSSGHPIDNPHLIVYDYNGFMDTIDSFSGTMKLPHAGEYHFDFTNCSGNGYEVSSTLMLSHFHPEEIPGATSATYAFTESDIDQKFLCKVHDTSGAYVGEVKSNTCQVMNPNLQGTVTAGTNGYTVFANIAGVQPDAVLNYEWWFENTAVQGGVILDEDSRDTTTRFTVESGRNPWVNIAIEKRSGADDSSMLSIVKLGEGEVYNKVIQWDTLLMDGIELGPGEYEVRYSYRGTLPQRVVVSTDQDSITSIAEKLPHKEDFFKPQMTGGYHCVVTDSSGKYKGSLVSNAASVTWRP